MRLWMWQIAMRRHLVVHEARVPRQRQQRLAGSDVRGRDQPPAPPVPVILRDAQHLPSSKR